MLIYILIYDTPFGDKIEGVFLKKKDAEDSLTEHPQLPECRIEEWRVIA